MADDNISTSTGAVSTGTVPASVPEVIAPVIESPSPETPAIVPVETPVVETPTDKKPAETLLGAEVKAVEAKPDATPETKPEIKPDGEVKPEDKKDEGDQSGEPAPLPTYESFVLPEGIELDNDRLTDFTKELGEFETLTKADHAETQKFAQKLVDRHVAEVKETVQRVTEGYAKQWEKQTNDWFKKSSEDPEIGGNRFETTKSAVLDAVGKYAGNTEQLAEFKTFMNDTGVGNHPSVIRLISNMQNEIKGLREKYESESDAKPLAANRPVAQKKGFYESMYGKMN